MPRTKLTYFTLTGKFYTDDELDSFGTHAFQTFEDVKRLSKERRLPGLIEGHSPFITLVEADGQRALIIPSDQDLKDGGEPLADLIDAARPFATQVTNGGICHEGITTEAKCCRCSKILRLREAVAIAEGK